MQPALTGLFCTALSAATAYVVARRAKPVQSSHGELERLANLISSTEQQITELRKQTVGGGNSESLRARLHELAEMLLKYTKRLEDVESSIMDKLDRALAAIEGKCKFVIVETLKATEERLARRQQADLERIATQAALMRGRLRGSATGDERSNAVLG